MDKVLEALENYVKFPQKISNFLEGEEGRK
jgi:hypothetical protein